MNEKIRYREKWNTMKIITSTVFLHENKFTLSPLINIKDHNLFMDMRMIMMDMCKVYLIPDT